MHGAPGFIIRRDSASTESKERNNVAVRPHNAMCGGAATVLFEFRTGVDYGCYYPTQYGAPDAHTMLIYIYII